MPEPRGKLLLTTYLFSDRINKALVSLELKPAYEDLLQVEYTSTDEYLRSLHQTIVTTAIKVSHF
jgi:hypothetical protein